MAAAAGPHVFFTYPLAYNPMKAALALAERGVMPLVVKQVDLFNGQSLSPEFLRSNPAATVPVLTKPDGVAIADSVAIVRYVNSMAPGPLGGADADQALANTWVDKLAAWDGNLFLAGASDASARALLGKLSEFKRRYAEARARENPDLAATYHAKLASIQAADTQATDDGAIKANSEQLASLLDEAEAQLGKTAFLAGGAYSIADIVFTPVLFRLGMAGKTAHYLKPRPHVSGYYERMKQRPSFDAAFGAASSGFTLAKWLLPALLKAQLASLTSRY